MRIKRTFLIALILVGTGPALPRALAAPPTRSAGKASRPAGTEHTNSLGMKFVRLEPGSFRMGFEGRPLPGELLKKKSHFSSGDFDERPAHRVQITKPLLMGVHEVTNAQYERFDPEHRKLRGRMGISREDDGAVVFVSWHDAVAFCEWLARKEGRPYRLPTEAEWEYACRAGTTTPFHTGTSLPAEFSKGDTRFANFEPVGLQVGSTRPNAWGLHDMHGNVEEWCHDWYGPYETGEQVNPVGRNGGDFKVTRGGSHSTEAYYLRSANRMGTLAEDRQWLTGFRVVLGELPPSEPLPSVGPKPYQRNISQAVPASLMKGPDPDKPYFRGPRVVVKMPQRETGPLYHKHTHFMAVTECPNGDLLAAWFSGMGEQGRELSVAASRLRHGSDEWDPASPFWDAPDRNDHAHALWHDGKGTIYHFNGLGARYRHLAILLRKSRDNGVTWSRARLILPGHDTGRHTVVESVFRAQDGEIVLPMDGRGGSVMALSRDDGLSWTDPGGNIRGTHAGITQLSDGRLMAFGRHGAINGMLPRSISADMGKTWSYTAGPFTSIHTGRRLALMRLEDGSLFCASFARDMSITDSAGEEHTINGLFGALSVDDGETWPYLRLLSGDGRRQLIETMGGAAFTIDGRLGEMIGYSAVCQSADGVIHVLSSHNHYAFNKKWLMTPAPPPPEPAPPPVFKDIPLEQDLPAVYEPKGPPSQHPWKWRLSGRGLVESELFSTASPGLLTIHTPRKVSFYSRSDALDGFGAVDPATGFTAEIRARILERRPDSHALLFELYDGGGQRYAIGVTETEVLWYEGDITKSAFLPLSQFVSLAEGLDNTDSMHSYRLAVRDDRVVQIYRDEKLIGVKRGRYRSPRFGYILIGAGPEARVMIDRVAYDLAGPRAPPPLVKGLTELPYRLEDSVLDTTSADFRHEGPSPAARWKDWPSFDVRDHGAVGDGQKLDTASIQKAIDLASASGGGRVVLAGGVFLSGALFLKPRAALAIEKDTVLRGTTDESQYPTIKTRLAGVDMPWPAGLVNADNIHGVRITGGGTIDGQGQYWWRKFNTEGPLGALAAGKPRPIIVSRSRDVYIGGLTIKNSPFWTCHVVYCENVDINNLTIRNAIDGVRAPSSDGIDIDSCRNVLVRNCDIDCDDDNIVIKSGRGGDGFRRNAPSENIVVKNCIARRGHGMVAIGTEIGGSVRNVYVANCRAEGTNSGVRFKSKIGRGGIIENVVYEDITMKDVGWAVRMRLTDTRSDFPQLVDPRIPVLGGELAIPRFRNILLKNIKAVDSGSCLSFRCAKNAPPFESITFENVDLHGAEDVGNPQEARFKNWNTSDLRVNGKKLFGDGSDGAPPGLYEAVLEATAHVQESRN